MSDEQVYRIEHDGFEGTVIGSYVTREGKEGVVLQQVGNGVVHVYHRRWLTPTSALVTADAPPAQEQRTSDGYASLRAANRARQREWDVHDVITPAYRSNELVGEIGEALERALDLVVLAAAAGRLANTIKKLERERLGIKGSRSTVAQLAEELADVNICTDLVAMAYDIDLEKATRDKFNMTSQNVGLKTRMIK